MFWTKKNYEVKMYEEKFKKAKEEYENDELKVLKKENPKKE